MIDKIFKIGILVLVVIFLFLYSQNVRQGRFAQSEVFVLDTQTGNVYNVISGRPYTFRTAKDLWGDPMLPMLPTRPMPDNP